jgi:uncharacterized protein (TIGR03118 family)
MRRQSLSPAPSVRLDVEPLKERSNPSAAFLETDLVSDRPGVAPLRDPYLVNGWGLAVGPDSFGVSARATAFNGLYAGDVAGSPVNAAPLRVFVPKGLPTGQVSNTTGQFPVTDGTNTATALFLFASESGLVSGWNPAVGGTAGQNPQYKPAEVGFAATDGAAYKGIALADNGAGNFLYLADFHNNKIDVLDSDFQKVTLGTGGFGTFTDPHLPAGFAPFNVAALDGKLYVSYARQDTFAEEDVAGPGHGFIDVFDLAGNFRERLVSRGVLDSPWGMVIAPAGFGDFGGDLLVGNSGDGRVYAFDPTTGALSGTLAQGPHHPVAIDGLRGLAFGNGTTAGDAGSLYFAAGPGGGAHGLFGKITANAAGTNPVSVALNGNTLTITGSPGSDTVRVALTRNGMLNVVAGGQSVGKFDPAAVATIEFTGYAGDDTFTADPGVTATVVADGGAGNDHLTGGGGSNVLLGGPGNDTLTGGSRRDILIGGTGPDTLIGGGDQDIVIGGTQSATTTPAGLLQVLGEWNSSDTYANRVAAIRAGTGGVPALDAITVTDDRLADTLTGGSGRDWFWALGTDLVLDRITGEQLD